MADNSMVYRLLSADPNTTDLLQGEHPEIPGEARSRVDNTRHRVTYL